MSSLKMTFSLTSLILIIALGLVFVPTSVMAHKITPDDVTDGSHTAGDGDPANHTAHPVVKSVTLLGDAADKYVGDDSFVVEIDFEAEDTPNGISVPTGTSTVALDSTTSGGFTTVETHRISSTKYRIRLDATGSLTSGDVEVLSVNPSTGTDDIFTPAAPETGDDPARASVTYDTIAPVVAAGTAQPMAGESFPLNNELEDPFDVVFVITDEALSGTDSTAMTLDGTSLTLMAEPDTVTFSNPRYLGSNKFAATVTPKMVDEDETAATSVTITASAMDKSGNTGTNTATVTLAARMADDDDDMDDADPPAAMIEVTELPSVGVKGMFHVRVEFTPAMDEDDVTVADHMFLSVMDSSDPAREVDVSVAMGTEDDPIDAPLITANLYDGTLEYDTRHEYTYPLVVTIDQDVLETSNADDDDASGEVGEAAPDPETPDTRPVATLTGPVGGDLLSGEFQVLITFSEATTLSEDEIVITPATAGHVTAGSLNPASGSSTTFTVRIQPFAGAEMITVTVADNMRIVPHAMNGSIMDSAPIGTVKSITGPADFDGTDPFVVEVEFEEELPAGSMLVMADLEVTGGAVTDVGRKVGSDTVYRVQITPMDTMDVEVGLSDTGMVKFEYGTDVEALTVAQKTDPPVPGAVSATFVAGSVPGTGTVTLAGTIGADDFASISDLPDLEYFFEQRGTINLNDDDATDENDDNSREVVISEILWGLDESSAVIGERTQFQFIELYNTTDAEVDVTGYTLVFSLDRPTDAKIDVDQVSSQPPFSLGLNFLSVGKSGRVTNTLAKDTTATLSPARIVSMFRNIAYDTVVKADHDANATENRKKQLAGVPDGNNIDSWKPSQRPDPETRDASGALDPQAARWVYATRNARHHPTPPGLLTASTYTSSPFRINEIGNDTGSDNDWVELHNVTGGAVKLENYALSAVTAKGTDTKLFDFAGDKYSVPAKGFVVIATRHPQYTDLATGINVSLAEKLEDAKELQDPKGLTHLYVVKPVNLPDDGKFTLILRSAHDKSGKSEAFVDVAASPEGGFEDVAIASKLWPLVGSGAPSGKVIKGEIKNYAAGKVYQRDKGDGRGDESFSVAVYTGIGYDVKAEVAATNYGTPGYANDARKVNEAGLTDGVITISEIMVDLGDSPRRNLPQWIELHNSSDTLGINLDGWKINIENAAEAGMDPETNTSYATLTLGAKTILPNQTVLIVARSGEVRNQNHFPQTRVVNLSTNPDHRKALAMSVRDFLTKPVLSTKGFSIELVDKDGVSVDRAGNIDGKRHTRDDLTTTWALPMSDEPESRSSILRVYVNGVGLPGGEEDSWKLASDTVLAVESHAYYGSDDDIGTPGYRFGGPLPVSLSKFRPERLKETGEIVVRWITESELNNAGFNILRSEKRDSEFTKVHFEAGQGTTSERSVYEWKDTTAKPNVVYYYQIQDVSLDGDVTTLRITHLRGNVTAAGKLTTTWGEIKALQ